MQSNVEAVPLRFYFTVVLLTLVDSTVLIGVVCLSLRLTGSAIPVGVVLCLSVAFPFLIERLLGNRVLRITLKSLAVIRVGVFALVILGSWLGMTRDVAGFLGVALAVGIADYFTVVAFESQNARFAVAKLMSPIQASRWFQTAVQLGNCGGDMVGGGLFDHVDGASFIWAVGITGLLASFLLLGMKSPLEGASSDVATAAAGASTVGMTRGLPPVNVSRAMSIGMNRSTALLVCIALFGLHIGAFNSMVPVVFLQLGGRDGTTYGLAAGLVGIGALAAVVLPGIQINRFAVAVALVMCDVVLVQVDSRFMFFGASLLLGYLFNYLRVNVREQLLGAARTTADADWVGSRSTYANLSMQSFGPLVFTFLLSGGVLSPRAAPWLMIGTGVALAAATFAVDAMAGLRRPAVPERVGTDNR
ncbi:hypothetical protein [Paraburkholderia sp. BCC1876]|uniref:hypothetical protein n=1 Tax=Paraburkholderia sp. BCC1876 TaxID=2676303 RepID=UPI001591B42E|nr:hypothetical protein [Paraburkholderia sp. BCC1876]